MPKCERCEIELTPKGLKLHKGSKRCDRRHYDLPLLKQVNNLRNDLTKKGLVPVFTNVANAIKARNAGELCGVTYQPTVFISGEDYGGDSEIRHEFWMYQWVSKIHYDYLRGVGSKVFYDKLEKLAAIEDPEEQENAKALFMLESLTFLLE